MCNEILIFGSGEVESLVWRHRQGQRYPNASWTAGFVLLEIENTKCLGHFFPSRLSVNCWMLCYNQPGDVIACLPRHFQQI